MPNTPITYTCNICNYNCGNRKSSYDRHMKSQRHLDKVNGVSASDADTDNNDDNMSEISQPQHIPSPPPPQRYISHYHPPQPLSHDANYIHLLNENTSLKCEISILKNDLLNTKEELHALKAEFYMFRDMNRNNEIQTIKTQQAITEQVIRMQPVATQPVRNHSAKQPAATAAAAETTPAPVVETKPGKPKLSEYLNTTFPGAVDFEYMMKNFDYNKIINKKNYNNATPYDCIKKTIIEMMREYPKETRPFHFIDKKTKKFITKEQNQWILNKDEYCLFDTIGYTLSLHITKIILNENNKLHELEEKYEEQYKNWDNESRESDEYVKQDIREKKKELLEKGLSSMIVSGNKDKAFQNLKEKDKKTLMMEFLDVFYIDVSHTENDLLYFLTEPAMRPVLEVEETKEERKEEVKAEDGGNATDSSTNSTSSPAPKIDKPKNRRLIIKEPEPTPEERMDYSKYDEKLVYIAERVDCILSKSDYKDWEIEEVLEKHELSYNVDLSYYAGMFKFIHSEYEYDHNEKMRRYLNALQNLKEIVEGNMYYEEEDGDEEKDEEDGY